MLTVPGPLGGIKGSRKVNHVTSISMEGRPSVTNSVLPRTNPDYVSYSTYDSLRNFPKRLPKALDYIETKLQPKAGPPGKRVFIGEYGFAACSISEEERNRRSRLLMRIGLEWGCPFVCCWQMYNNEYKDGKENGYWMIVHNEHDATRVTTRQEWLK